MHPVVNTSLVDVVPNDARVHPLPFQIKFHDYSSQQSRLREEGVDPEPKIVRPPIGANIGVGLLHAARGEF